MKAFNLFNHIHFNYKICNIKKCNDSNQWIFYYKVSKTDCKNDETEVKETIHTAMIGYGAKFMKIGYCVSEYDDVKAIAVSLKSVQLPSVRTISVGHISLAEGSMLLLNLQ